MLAERARRLTPSPTLALSARARALRAQGIDVLSFTAGEPDFDTPERVKEAAIRALREGKTKYTDAGGIPELKAAICAKLKRDNGLAYEPADVIASVGREAHALQHLRGPGRPRGRGPGAVAVLGELHGAGASLRRRARRGADRRAARVPARPGGAAARGDAPHEAAHPEQPEQPERGRVPAGRPREGRRARARAQVLRRVRRVLRRAVLRRARAEHRGAEPRDQGADDPRQHVLEGLRDDGVAARLRRGAARDREGDGRSPGAVHVEPDLDRPVGGRRGARAGPRTRSPRWRASSTSGGA